MKFLCDVHISLKISKQLDQKGFSSIHVNRILDKWHTKDKDIMDYADKNDMILISKDQDFKNSFLLHRRPKKLVKVSLGNISNQLLLDILVEHLEKIKKLYTMESVFMLEIVKVGNDVMLSLTKGGLE